MIVACYQSYGSGWDRTKLITASKDGDSAVQSFIRDHYMSGSNKRLHTFSSEEEAYINYRCSLD